MSSIIKSVVKVFVGQIGQLLFGLNILTPCIIVRIDGGICSQMHQYLIGEIFKKKGIKVKYDLSFFKKNGKDLTGKYARDFSLLKMFPYLSFDIASSWMVKFYYWNYNHIGNYPNDMGVDWMNLQAPCLLSGYYRDPYFLYNDLFQNVFKILDRNVMDISNQKIYDSIQGDGTVAVHVRRGDLSEYIIGYGYPVTIQYFIDAITYMQHNLSNPVFYFFSDDKEYVCKNLLPAIPFPVKSIIVENSSEKGYIDLLLISKCKHQITSKGSLGKFGALLQIATDKIVIVSKDDQQTFMFDNTICQKIVI